MSTMDEKLDEIEQRGYESFVHRGITPLRAMLLAAVALAREESARVHSMVSCAECFKHEQARAQDRALMERAMWALVDAQRNCPRCRGSVSMTPCPKCGEWLATLAALRARQEQAWL